MKKQFLAIVATLLLTMIGLTSQLSAQNKFEHGDFSRFVFPENNKSKSYNVEKNPDGTDEFVESFYIDGTKCRGDDCNHGSVRSQLKTNIWDDSRPRSISSPQEAWYSFEIYLPEDFPYGLDQVRGGYILNEFKESNECASFYFAHFNGYNDNNLYLTLGEYTGGEDTRFPGAPDECIAYYQEPVARMSALKGRWTRFEYFVRWSEAKDGYIRVFRDGEHVFARKGRNCRKIEQCLERNIFYYGIYKPNNKPLSDVRPAKVFFRNVSMAQKREELLR